MPPTSINFKADGIALKPPTINDEILVVLSTGVYELAKLQPAYLWQGERGIYKVTITKFDPDTDLDDIDAYDDLIDEVGNTG